MGEIEQRHLRFFIAVAEELNITRASQRLHTAQPSLGRQIRKLENMVGTPLLLRQGHRLELTAAGRDLLVRARLLLQEMNMMVTAAQQASLNEAESIVIAISPGASWAALSRLLPLFSLRYPKTRLISRNLFSAEQIISLQNRSINVGFLRGPIPDPTIVSEVIRSDRIVAVLHAKHPLAKLKRIPIERLTELPLVISRHIYPTMMSLAARIGVTFRTGVQADGILEALSAVRAGLGLSLMPDCYAQILPRTVVTRPLAVVPPFTIDLLLGYRKDDRLPTLPLFLSLARDCFAQRDTQ